MLLNSSRKVLLAACIALLSGGSAYAAEFISILTGGTSGVYYPLGVALSQIYGKALPDAKSSVQATKASAENLNLLQAGRGELAFTLGDALSDAWKGNEEVGFKVPLKTSRRRRRLFELYPIVASADSGIKSLADLRGKRVAVGAPKSGTEINTRAILKGAGMTYKDLGKVEMLPFGESAELMKNRQIDATVISAGLGVSAIRDLATAVKMTVVPIPADVVAKINDPAYIAGVIPANTYDGQAASVNTVAIENFIVTHEGVPTETVYKMTKAMYENLAQMVAAHTAAKAIKVEEGPKNMPLPLHPGAEKYSAKLA